MMKESNRKIGRRLKRYRVERELTQEKMAELMEISLTFYGQIERGESGISIEKIILLYECLGIDPTHLLIGVPQ